MADLELKRAREWFRVEETRTSFLRELEASLKDKRVAPIKITVKQLTVLQMLADNPGLTATEHLKLNRLTGLSRILWLLKSREWGLARVEIDRSERGNPRKLYVSETGWRALEEFDKRIASIGGVPITRRRKRRPNVIDLAAQRRKRA